MKRFAAIIGLPGSGKTTLMRELMSNYDWTYDKPIDLVESYVSGSTRLIGKYEEGEVFAGTDRLSMAVQPKFIEYLENNQDEVIIFEGDRLTSVALFDKVEKLGYDMRIFVLKASEETLQKRYKERGSDQSEKFIQGRRTKIANVEERFGDNVLFGESGCVVECVNETPEQMHQNIKTILNFIG